MDNDATKSIYIAFRYIEGICIAVFVFGFLWNGTEMIKLTFPQFMMLYGGSGAIICEFVSRFLVKQVKKKITTKGKTKNGLP